MAIINIAFPLKRGTKEIFAVNETTIEAVKDDLVLLIISNHGERPIHFDYGANLRALLFEQQGPDFSIMAEDSITTAIEKWLPFITLRSVQVQTSADASTLKPNEVKVKIEFSVGQESGVLDRRIVL